ncbi:MAG: lactonase family protein, partial [Bryobacteraceae bacterium]
LGEASAFEQHVDSSPPSGGPRQPRGHMALFSPDNRFLLVADLGLDRVYVYRFDASKGALAPGDPAFATVEPGAGPRHLAFHPKGDTLYSINERNSTVTAFRYERASGRLSRVETVSTLPSGFAGKNTGAEIAAGRTGRFLYTSNRGLDSIAIFSIDSARRALSLVGNAPTQGQTPRNFAIDPTGPWLIAANQASDSLVVFRVDRANGTLTPAGEIVKDAPAPTCILFVPVK